MKITPEALAELVADRTAARLAPVLRELVDQALADWAPTCRCENPIVEGDGCVRCGRRTS